MRPTTSWTDLARAGDAGARVGVWGLGVEGRASLRRLALAGIRPVAVDDRGPGALADGAARLASGLDGPVLAPSAGGLDALGACEVVIKSPGISRHGDACRALLEAGVTVVGGLGLWLEEQDRSRVLCITGTKGKSTTTAIAGHLLTRWGYRARVAGNIGVPPWDPAAAQAADWWVVEVSSYQATDIGTGPEVVAVTSLHADHLTWHGDEETYVRDKLSLCTRPGVRVVVANGDDAGLQSRADLLGPKVRWTEPDDRDWVDLLGLVGTHNRANAAVACVALIEMGVAQAGDEAALAGAARGFPGLGSRLQLVASVGGVDFVDDSLATNVLPTLAALSSFPERRVALLVGGHDRGIDYSPLARGLHRRSERTLIVTLPDNGGRIADALAADPAPAATVVSAAELSDGVRMAFEWARPDGLVLLSPAAPSFGRYRDYRERAEAFVTAVRELAPR